MPSPPLPLPIIAAKWNVAEGGSFIAGQSIASIETDKAVVDFEAQDDGVLAKILKHPKDGEIKVGQPMCVVVENAADAKAFANYKPEAAAAASPSSSSSSPAVPAAAAASPPSAAASSPHGKVDSKLPVSSRLLPSARHLVESKGLDAGPLFPGSGKGGRVTKGDVVQNLGTLNKAPERKQKQEHAGTFPAAALSPAPPSLQPSVQKRSIESSSSFVDVPLTGMRKVIASRLASSKGTVPHTYVKASVDLSSLLALRTRLAPTAKVSVNDLVILAASRALRDHPSVNSKWDDKSGAVVRMPSVDVCVAVATPTGLITPIIFGADNMQLRDIARTVGDLAARAKVGGLKPAEYQGGSFTISNLGMFGVAEFTAIINPPQAVILAVGAGADTVVVSADAGKGGVGGGCTTRNVMNLQLSCDARVVNGALAGNFLKTLSDYLQEPERMIL